MTQNTQKEEAIRLFNEVSEADLDEAFALVEKHNAIVDPDDKRGYGEKGASFWIIEPTGKHQVYYTLYRLNHLAINPRCPNPSYIQNLSMDVLEAVKKMATGKGLAIELGGVDTYKAKKGYTIEGLPFLSFGKYNGKTLDVVYESDPNYVLWFAKNYDPYTYFYGIGKTTDKKLGLRDHAKALADAHFQAIISTNQAECNSEYQGTLKDRREWELTLYGIKVVEGIGGYTIVYFKDNNENLFFAYYDKEELVKGKTYKFKGTIAGHKERMGKKFTRLNRLAF